MTKSQAIQTYINQSKIVQCAIERLMKWDSRLTIRENSDLLGIGRDHAYCIYKKYKLKAKVNKLGNWGTL